MQRRKRSRNKAHKSPVLFFIINFFSLFLFLVYLCVCISLSFSSLLFFYTQWSKEIGTKVNRVCKVVKLSIVVLCVVYRRFFFWYLFPFPVTQLLVTDVTVTFWIYIYIFFFCLEKGIRCVIKLSFVWICHWYFRSSSFSKRPLRLCSELTLRRVVKFAWLAVQVAVGEDKAEREPACYGRITISRYARGRYAIRVLPRHKKKPPRWVAHDIREGTRDAGWFSLLKSTNCIDSSSKGNSRPR